MILKTPATSSSRIARIAFECRRGGVHKALKTAGACVRFSFCVGCGSTDDLQQHQLVTRCEGGEVTSLITLCLGCDGRAKALAQSGAASTPGELLRRLKIMARSPLSRKPHDRER